MSDKGKPIQTPFDKTVSNLQQKQRSDASGEDQIREDIGLGDDGLSDPLEKDNEPDYADQDDQEAYVEDYDSNI